ncbi:rab escort protein 1-like isoform X2 [Quercus lobata]|uniref:rab escort protein 1-like isoform X2 n=1 Tax=Quercus lobata TaxID=97700 RepID=UPI0012445988|nr:rab escort protein 1-like isoform X2 [Quercus lobata]
MSEDASSYPPIEPTKFDLIVVGTGLPESVIAAAASANGKTVLHLDPNSSYGSHYASLSLHDLSNFLNSHPAPPPSTSSNGHDFTPVPLAPRPLYSHVEISSFVPEILDDEHSRKFNIDLCGPRVLFCADKSIDLILKSGANQYIDFKSIESSFVCDASGRLTNVPDSRAAIFKDKSLGLTEKNQLMRLFKLVQQHLGGGENENERISGQDLESPFVEFLKKMRLPPKIKSIILYAIAMADYDQDNVELCEDVLKTKDGIDRLALYNSSVGRFPNAFGAFLYPIYGHGELPQAFCRRAAVKGCIHVLRMPMIALLMDKCTGHYKGVRLSSGQDLFSHQLILDPSSVVPLPLISSPTDSPRENRQILGLGDEKRKVARGICITRSSLRPDTSNFLVVYPPRSLYPEQVTSIRALQIGSDLAVCPSGMFVLYFCTLCHDANQGIKSLNAAMDSLLTLPKSSHSESSTTVHSENSAEVKPTVLWKALYIQELTMDQFESINSTAMPDGKFNYNNILDAALKLFQKMYPDEEFFPETVSPENPEDDNEFSLES